MSNSLATEASTEGRIRSAQNYLCTSVDGASLAVFRMFFGALMAAEAFYHYYGNIDRWYSPDDFHFTYGFFHWVTPWPGIGMQLHIIAMGVAAIALAFGLFYRAAAISFTVLYAYMCLIEEATYNNHYYLTVLIGILFSVSNAHSAFSLDRHRNLRNLDQSIPFWNLIMFRAQMVIVYFGGGIAKISPDWLRGEPVRHWLANRDDFPLVGRFFHDEWCVYLVAYGGLIFDLGIGFMLLNRRTRLWALPFLFLFHGMNNILFQIGIFPILALAYTLLFFPSDTPRKWLKRLGMRLSPPETTSPTRSVAYGNVVLVFVCAFLFIQCALPLRHWLYPGNANWTEQGHTFAWHMKLRDKSARGVFRVVDQKGNEVAVIRREQQLDDMHSRKRSRMLARPQLIIQYAHLLRDQYVVFGVESPKVYAEVTASLNGRSFQPLIDPDVDLAAATYSQFRATPWILPLRKDLRIGLYSP